MKLIVDEDVAKVVEFMMHAHIPAQKLQDVARGVVQLAELLWPEDDLWQKPRFSPLRLQIDPFNASPCSGGLRPPPDATPHPPDGLNAIQAHDHGSASRSEEDREL
jgi:hypothetical protein